MMWNLTNVPSKSDGRVIEAVVRGSEVMVVCREPHAEKDDWLLMCSTRVGDHMFSMRDELRMMIGRELASAIRLARDAGYKQALRDVRNALGV